MTKFKNLGELVFNVVKHYDNSQFLNYKKDDKWVRYSCDEFVDLVFYFAIGLRKSGFKKGSRLVNYSYQNPIWLIVDLATIVAGGVSVPIFDNISAQHLQYQVEHSKADFIFMDGDKDYDFDGVAHVDFEKTIALGRQYGQEFSVSDFLQDIKEDDLATIIYTSGSTGNPKGVMISHKNLVVQVESTMKCFDIVNGRDVALSFLPMAHIFERMVMLFYMSRGISVHFVDDINALGEYLKEVKPTLMTTVPRMLEKVFAKINVGIESGGVFKKLLGIRALKRALAKDSCSNQTWLDRIFDRLVYKKFRLALGGKMDMIICGGAALSEDMERFYRNIGINLLCGYGLTEASPVLSVNSKQNYKFSSVGKTFDCVELQISPEGELLARGDNIMLGYLDNEQETKRVIKDGWLYTGDLATIDEDGFVKITGRKKEMFKTSYGKYVAPVPIEQKIMLALGFCLGVVVIAEAKKFVSALIFPDFDNLSIIKNKLNVKTSDQEFLNGIQLEEYVKHKIDEINKELDSWQQIKKFKIIDQKISIESGEITPSMKLKRQTIEQKFQNQITQLYQN